MANFEEEQEFLDSIIQDDKYEWWTGCLRDDVVKIMADVYVPYWRAEVLYQSGRWMSFKNRLKESIHKDAHKWITKSAFNRLQSRENEVDSDDGSSEIDQAQEGPTIYVGEPQADATASNLPSNVPLTNAENQPQEKATASNAENQPAGNGEEIIASTSKSVAMPDNTSDAGDGSHIMSTKTPSGAPSSDNKNEDPNKKTLKRKYGEIEDEEKCPICLDQLSAQPKIKSLHCHEFHKKCLFTWVRQGDGNGDCPLCRQCITCKGKRCEVILYFYDEEPQGDPMDHFYMQLRHL